MISKVKSRVDFNSAKSSTGYIWNLCSVVSEARAILEKQLGPCLVKTSNIAGINREFSQAAFFRVTCQDLKELSAVISDHRLRSNNQENNLKLLVKPIAIEETDITH